MPLPLKETANEKRCKCGHRFSFLVCIETGLSLAGGSVYALACPDCGEPKIIATSDLSVKEAEEKVRKLIARQVSFLDAEDAYVKAQEVSGARGISPSLSSQETAHEAAGAEESLRDGGEGAREREEGDGESSPNDAQNQ